MKFLVLMILEKYENDLILLTKFGFFFVFEFSRVLIMVVVEQQMKFVIDQLKVK